jgi:hypothetical protein
MATAPTTLQSASDVPLSIGMVPREEGNSLVSGRRPRVPLVRRAVIVAVFAALAGVTWSLLRSPVAAERNAAAPAGAVVPSVTAAVAAPSPTDASSPSLAAPRAAGVGERAFELLPSRVPAPLEVAPPKRRDSKHSEPAERVAPRLERHRTDGATSPATPSNRTRGALTCSIEHADMGPVRQPAVMMAGRTEGPSTFTRRTEEQATQ